MDTIVERLFAHAEKTPDAPAMWYRDGQDWENYTWATYKTAVLDFAGGLLSIGYEPGDAVVIMGNNCAEWVIADVAAMAIRGVPAGIYQTSTLDQAKYIAEHCEARVMVIENREIWDHLDLDNNRELFPTIEIFIAIQEAELIAHDDCESFDDFCERGKGRHNDVEARRETTDYNELATLIYTSGTTGPPKGVMLSHENLAWTAQSGYEIVSDIHQEGDCMVSYLPLSHIAEQLFSIHLPITAGVPIYFAKSIDAVRDTIGEARPVLFLGVPRVWEKFKTALEQRLEAEATGVKGAIVRASRNTLLECGHVIIKDGAQALTFSQQIRYRIAMRLFAEKLKSKIGFDRLKLAITSAAPISYDVLEFFLSCGIILHEAYGQSEDNGPTTINFPEPGKRKLGSAGMPFPGTEVKIADDGEILVRGKNVFLGYYKNPEATAETLIDGWLHSGDIGEFDEDGFLKITDRKKDLIITAGGKNVAPQNIEKTMRGIDGISQVVVVGDRQPYLVALFTIDQERAPDLFRKFGVDSINELAINERFQGYINDEVQKRNEGLARYETVKKFDLLPEDFSVESGELTPTQKVKRRVVNERYASNINELYAK